MRRRLYFLLPNVKEAEKILDKLLLKRICIHHIHVMAKDGTDLGALPEATLLQKNDIVHSIIIGLWVGAIIGIIGGIIGHNALGVEVGGVLVVTTVIGALLGAWSASMVGMMSPNVHLKQFLKPIKEGQLLMMVDVAKERIEEIEELFKKYRPRTDYKGIEPTIPGFP